MITPEEFFESIHITYNCPWCGESLVDSNRRPKGKDYLTGIVYCHKCKDMYIRIYRHKDVQNAVYEIFNWTKQINRIYRD